MYITVYSLAVGDLTIHVDPSSAGMMVKCQLCVFPRNILLILLKTIVYQYQYMHFNFVYDRLSRTVQCSTIPLRLFLAWVVKNV